MQTQTESFWLFKKILNNFSQSETPEQKEAREKISNYFDLCLKNNSYLICLDLINNHYKPNAKQTKLLNNGVIKKNKEDPDFITQYYEKNPNISSELFLDWVYSHKKNDNNAVIKKLFEDKNFILSPFNKIDRQLKKEAHTIFKNIKIGNEKYGLINSTDTPQAVQDHNTKLVYMLKTQIGLSKKIIALHFNSSNFSKELLLSHKENVQYVSDLLEYYCKDLYSSTIKRKLEFHEYNRKNLYLNVIKNYLTELEQYISHKLNEQREDIIQSLNEMHTLDSLNNTINTKLKIRTIDIHTDLPETARNLLESINIKYQKIKQSQDGSLDQSMIDLDILYQKNAIKIIEQFLSIDDEFKDNLKDKNGKSPENIMMDALNEINSVLDNKLLELNIKKVRDLSISNDVVQAKKLSN